MIRPLLYLLLRMHVRRRTAPGIRRLVLPALAALLLLGGVGAAPAQAADAGWIRLAHLSPDTPAVDIYLSAFDKPGAATVLPGVDYGTLSGYRRLPAGLYTVSMRKPGASASSKPLISTNVKVAKGRSYTIAGIGPNASLQLRVITDDLATPPSGRARVRVINAAAAAQVVDLSTTDGTKIARDSRFATTTPYAEVPAGTWPVEVRPQEGGAQAQKATLKLAPGAVYSVLVLDAKGGDGLQVVARKDSASAMVVPHGSVNTGLGGSAGGAPSTASPSVPVGGLALLALLTPVAAVVGHARVRRRRRRAAAGQ